MSTETVISHDLNVEELDALINSSVYIAALLEDRNVLEKYVEALIEVDPLMAMHHIIILRWCWRLAKELR